MKLKSSISIDVDNLWTYLKIKGDPKWQTFPSYLEEFLPYFLDLLDEAKLKITFFLVGRDLTSPAIKPLAKEIVLRGHEVGNHTFNHEPWMHTYCREELEEEIIQAEQIIYEVTGEIPRGFRGPGFTWSQELFELLSKRNYLYDSSTLPSFIGPLARLYYFSVSHIKGEERSKRENLFGSVKDGLRPNKPYFWKTEHSKLLEIPVTTIPFFKTPFHLSYLMYLGGHSAKFSLKYLDMALLFCKMTKTAPNFLLHPPDFLGLTEAPDMHFFPGMKLSKEEKRDLFFRVLEKFSKDFECMPLSKRAEAEITKSLPEIAV